MRTTPGAPHVAVRLNDAERALVADIQSALSTSLLPVVSISDALRAGLRELHGRIVRERGHAV